MLPCMLSIPHAFVWPPVCSDTTSDICMFPVLPYASTCSRGYLHVIGGCRGPPSVWTSPMCFGCLGHVSFIPHSICDAPCMYYVLGVISALCYGGNNPCHVGGQGVSAHLSGFWCLYSTGCLSDVHYASCCCTFLCSFIMSQVFYLPWL